MTNTSPKSGFLLTGAFDPDNLRPMSELADVERTLDELEANQRAADWSKPVKASATVDRAEIERRLGRSR